MLLEPCLLPGEATTRARVAGAQDDIYREEGRRTVAPVAAERRAASRISVTVTFVSSEENPSSLAPSTTTARGYDRELSYGAGTGLAASCCSLLDPLLRTRRSLPATVIAYPVWPYTSMSLRPKGQFHEACTMACAFGYVRMIVASSSTRE